MEAFGGLLIIVFIVYLMVDSRYRNNSSGESEQFEYYEPGAHGRRKKTAKIKHVHKHVAPKEKKASRFSNSLHCPKCRSFNVQLVGNSRKGFSVGKAVGGSIILPGAGALAGFAGKNNKKPKFHCSSCGNIFKYKL